MLTGLPEAVTEAEAMIILIDLDSYRVETTRANRGLASHMADGLCSLYPNPQSFY